MPEIQEFVQSIGSDNLADDVARHFDKVIGLYYLIGERPDLDINIAKIDGKFGFSVLVEKEENATNLAEQFDGTNFKCYGKPMYVRVYHETSDCVSFLLTKKKV